MRRVDTNYLLNGFTLVELLVVIATITVLMFLAVIAYRSQVFKGYDARRKTDIYQIKIALEEYEKDNNCYPQALPACEPGNGLQPYIPKIPCDPGDKTDYVYTPDTSGSTCPKWYWIFTTLDNENDPQIEELGCQNGCGPTLGTANYNYYQTSPNAPEPAKK
jgi:prepilin-type N-terminal cleavage/methylation domain-containing protein